MPLEKPLNNQKPGKPINQKTSRKKKKDHGDDEKRDWCHRYGHNSSVCHYKKDNDRSMFKCDFCDLPWCTTDKCYKKKRADERKAEPDDRVMLSLALALTHHDKTNLSTKWILDSGATAHLTNDKQHLYNLK